MIRFNRPIRLFESCIHQLIGARFIESLSHRASEPLSILGERAITLDPNDADSYAFQADGLNHAGWPEEALKPDFVDAQLSPVGTAYALAGRYEEAVAPLKQYLSHYPNIVGPHLTLTAVYSELGQEA